MKVQWKLIDSNAYRKKFRRIIQIPSRTFDVISNFFCCGEYITNQEEILSLTWPQLVRRFKLQG